MTIQEAKLLLTRMTALLQTLIDTEFADKECTLLALALDKEICVFLANTKRGIETDIRNNKQINDDWKKWEDKDFVDTWNLYKKEQRNFLFVHLKMVELIKDPQFHLSSEEYIEFINDLQVFEEITQPEQNNIARYLQNIEKPRIQ